MVLLRGSQGETLDKHVKSSFEELKKVGLKIWLQCEKCGVMWSFGAQSGEKLPQDYWQCPKKCNVRRDLVH